MMKSSSQAALPSFSGKYGTRNGVLLRSLLLISLLLLAACSSPTAQQPPQSTVPPTKTPRPASQISVNTGQTRATIPDTAFGVNTAVWDNNMLSPDVPDRLHQAGVTLLRFPGGSLSDIYHWQHNSLTPGKGSYVNPNNTFDAFMNIVQRVGAQAMITVNYGTNQLGTDGGDPAEAADWVRYANITKHYNIKYWEIGNEVYGNGTYGGQWEADQHAEKGPAAYANNILAFVNAMKAVDPTIKIGVSLTSPTDRINPPVSKMANWNPTLLSMACSQIDFVDIHWYPRMHNDENMGPDAQLLSRPDRVASVIAQPRSEINQYCGSHAKDVQVFLGEVNTDIHPKQRVNLVNALFLADLYMAWLENGGSNVTWWELHDGINPAGDNSSTVYGSSNYSDLGILSSGNQQCNANQCEPPVNTPFAPYYGLQMLTHLGKPGDTIVTATSRLALVSVHAVKQANGNLAVLLINKDPGASATPTLVLSGYTPASTATTYSFGMNDTAISSNSMHVAGSTLQTTLPPYSLTTIVFTRK